MVRNAEEKDLITIVEMGELFHAEAGLDKVASYNRFHTYKMVEELLNAPEGILLVAEKDGEIIGMTGGITYPMYFNQDSISGQEMFWYVEPEYRNGTIGIKMLREMEKQAKERGCDTFTMISEDYLNPEALDKMYLKSGYRRYEHTYVRNL